MYTQIIHLALAITNLILERTKNDPISAEKVRRGEPLTLEDFLRLGVDREAAGKELDDAIEQAGG